jgi:hypothetical protein
MSLPWTALKLLFKVVGPSIPDIISTVKSLKKERPQERIALDDATAHLLALEKRIETQLQLIEQLTVQMEKLEKAYRLVSFLALFALALALIALGLIVFQAR